MVEVVPLVGRMKYILSTFVVWILCGFSHENPFFGIVYRAVGTVVGAEGHVVPQIMAAIEAFFLSNSYFCLPTIFSDLPTALVLMQV